LSKEEFWGLTPAEFWAMKYRKDVEFRHQCFVAGITASDYRNAHRSDDSQRVYSPLDYTPCEQMSEEEILHEQEEQNRAALATALSAGLIKAKGKK
jgi:hypothetical protein